MTAPKYKILIISDKSANFHSLTSILSHEKFQIMNTDKASEAMEILKKRNIDILITDTTIRDSDGYTFCKTIKEHPKYKKIPVLMRLSALLHQRKE